MSLARKLRNFKRLRSQSIEYQGVNVDRNPAVISDEIWKFLSRDRYETKELRAAQAMIQPGDRLLELGAGLGIVSAVLAKTTPLAAITAVEANPKLHEPITQLWQKNGISNATLKHGIVSRDSSGMAEFYLRDNFWSSSLEPDSAPFTEKVSVPVTRLDDILEEVKPTVIVSDIEGGEIELFGTGQIFAGVRAIVMELHRSKTSDAAVKAVFDTLSSQGFGYYAPCSTGEIVAFQRID